MLCGVLLTGYMLWGGADSSTATQASNATVSTQLSGQATTLPTVGQEPTLSTAETTSMATTDTEAQSETSSDVSKLLVFTKTSVYRHASIPAGIAMFKEFASTGEFTVDFSEDSAIFATPEAQSYDAVVFLNTDSVVFATDQEKQDFQAFIRSGKGYIGIHGASATHWRDDKWDWYKQLVGQRFVEHPEPQQATIERTDIAHQSTDHLEQRWTIYDEWYNFDAQPMNVDVILTLDETSYNGGTMGSPHPIAWHHTFEGSRSWYTAVGHEISTYENEAYRKHVLGGVRWVLADT